MTTSPIRVRSASPGTVVLKIVSRLAIASTAVAATACAGLLVGRVAIARYDDPLVRSEAPIFVRHIKSISRNAGTLGALTGYCLGIGSAIVFGQLQRVEREEADSLATPDEMELIEAARSGNLDQIVSVSARIEDRA